MSSLGIRGGIALVLGCSVLLSACADPCFDDGLAQGGCPADSASASQTDSNSESQGSASQSATVSDSASGSDTDPTVGTDSGGGLECPEVAEILLPQVPTVQLVVDQSGSMNRDFGATSRWGAIESTLVGDDGVVTRLQSRVRFGLSLYSTEGSTCPRVVGFAPRLDAGQDIAGMFADNEPLSETPTGESIREALDTLLEDTWQGDKVFVLATDGEPDTCEIPNPENDEEVAIARGAVLDAVRDAHDAGIRTFVISVGDEIAEDHLQEVANVGVGAQAGEPDAPFYVALNQAELVAAFEEIITGIRSCRIDLPSPLTPDLAPSCTVQINTDVSVYDDPDGWRLDGQDAIELQGQSCAAIQDGAVVILMTCTCEVSS
jgi:hypothetical protein